MKKLIILALFVLLIFQMFPAFGEEQPESCCSHMPIEAKNPNDHDCQVIVQGLVCCENMSLRTTTSTTRSSGSHRVDGDICEITTIKKYAVEKCRNCGAVHSKILIDEDTKHSHPKCPIRMF